MVQIQKKAAPGATNTEGGKGNHTPKDMLHPHMKHYITLGLGLPYPIFES